jgi:hypothetical protein
MTIHLGYVATGATIYIPFHTFNSSGASVTISGLAVTDIEIYKNGSVTQRSSDAGYTLLDTDGIDFDGLTGIHGFSIDLNDNTDAGFYAAGSFYWVVVSAVTVDSQTVSFVAATFFLGPVQANVTQFGGTNGTFASGRPEINLSHIAGSAVSTTTAQLGVNVVQLSGDSTAADNLENAFDDTAGAVPWQLISDQGTLQSVGSTTEVTLRAAASAENDVYIGHTIHFVSGTTGVKQSALISDYVGATKVATLAAAVPVALTGTVVYKIVATAPASGGGTAPTAAEVADAVWDEATAGHTTSGTFGEQLKTDVDAILADTNELQTDWVNGGRLDLLLDATLADTNELQTDWANGGRLDLLIDATLADTNELQTDWANGGRLDLLLDGVKAKTDSLTFTVASVLDVNTLRINGVTVIGAGTSGDKWRA